MGDDSFIMTRKIKVIPVGDEEERARAYKYIRDARYAQNKAYNILISSVYSAIMSGKNIDEINDIYKRGGRKPKEDDPEYSLYEYGGIEFPVGMHIPSDLPRKVKGDLQKAKKDGLFKGNSSLPNKRRISALDIHVNYIKPMCFNHLKMGLYHNYDTDEVLYQELRSGNPEIYWKFCNGIKFKLVIRNPHKDAWLRSELERIFRGEYKVNGSQINIIDNKDKKKKQKEGEKKKPSEIELHLSFSVPKQKMELKEDVVVGVDVGVAIPAVCAVNINPDIKLFAGAYVKDGQYHEGTSELLRQRTALQKQRMRHQANLKYCNGGHGRKKKLKSLKKLKDRERNFVNTYNHKISKAVVDFALRWRAKYINIEDLKGYDASDFILRNWSYFELQTMIAYKAKRYGIEVRKIKPAYTSQTCSYCGNVDKKQRLSQSEFRCLNPECEKYMEVQNADFNAARNISMSTNFSKDKDDDNQ